MSGHSKWSSIKHQKGATDAKRGQIFTQLGHAISIAAKIGGLDPTMNPRLALAIEMAKKQNMPKENIERALKRVNGEADEGQTFEVTYEAYGPGGIAIMIEAVTDNRNRTISQIRATLNKYRGKLAESGSVAYLFKQTGVLEIEKNQDRDAQELMIVDSDANDYHETETSFWLFTAPNQVSEIKNQLESKDLNVIMASIRLEPIQTIEINDRQTVEDIFKLLYALQELDDVANVVGNQSELEN